MFNTFRFHQTIYNTSYQLALASCWTWSDRICGNFFLPWAGKWLWTSPADLARKEERVRHRKAHGGGNLGRNGIRPGECLTSFNVSRSQFACGPKVNPDEFTLKRGGNKKRYDSFKERISRLSLEVSLWSGFKWICPLKGKEKRHFKISLRL